MMIIAHLKEFFRLKGKEIKEELSFAPWEEIATFAGAMIFFLFLAFTIPPLIGIPSQYLWRAILIEDIYKDGIYMALWESGVFTIFALFILAIVGYVSYVFGKWVRENWKQAGINVRRKYIKDWKPPKKKRKK